MEKFIPIQDPGKVYTIADYKNKQYRYTMSEYAGEIERLTECADPDSMVVS